MITSGACDGMGRGMQRISGQRWGRWQLYTENHNRRSAQTMSKFRKMRKSVNHELLFPLLWQTYAVKAVMMNLTTNRPSTSTLVPCPLVSMSMNSSRLIKLQPDRHLRPILPSLLFISTMLHLSCTGQISMIISLLHPCSHHQIKTH